jgi:NADH dehydrogenase FAD-containing subunit
MMPHSDVSHVILLGSGFAAMEVARGLKSRSHRVTMVSPRNHFLFTPLLTPSAVGTVELRNITKPVRDQLPDVTFYQARCVAIEPETKEIVCEAEGDENTFRLSYDQLVIAIGGENNTFGTPGVKEHAVFLKEAHQAHLIRQRILECLERASLPGISSQEKKQLLHWIVVGGGPTGAECMAEIHDWVEDVSTKYPESTDAVQLTLLEATDELLPGFDQALKEYAAKRFHREGVRVRKEAPAKEVRADRVILASGEELLCGLVVWSTGIRPRPEMEAFDLPVTDKGFLRTDETCRVIGKSDIYALGDTARMENRDDPVTAQLAQQQGAYLAKQFRRRAKGKAEQPFRFHNKGKLAYLGGRKALADTPVGSITGRMAWIFWRSVYLTKLMGWRNKWNVLRDWIQTGLFGRETSKIP